MKLQNDESPFLAERQLGWHTYSCVILWTCAILGFLLWRLVVYIRMQYRKYFFNIEPLDLARQPDRKAPQKGSQDSKQTFRYIEDEMGVPSVGIMRLKRVIKTSKKDRGPKDPENEIEVLSDPEENPYLKEILAASRDSSSEGSEAGGKQTGRRKRKNGVPQFYTGRCELRNDKTHSKK